mmetsp:Transcript_57545/g.65650  ORF Transcript_57545/g.65650 Transcript_57545/m.65650 type:complete len:335 (+) Transcript_57545:59-1063(+)
MVESATASSGGSTSQDINELFIDKHEKFFQLADKIEELDPMAYLSNEHLRVPGAYWTITALDVLNCLNDSRKQEITSWILSCQNDDGGFGGNLGHDSHITSTHYAVLVMASYDALDMLDQDRVVGYFKSLQQSDGSFAGDSWGEVDCRFSYNAASCLKILNRLHDVDTEKMRDYVLACKNFDGAFGAVPEAESHAAYTFVCLGTLAVLDCLDRVNIDELGAWLSERQTLKGGFNGRPEKLPDVCYSWWVLSCCYMIDRHDWISKENLKKFIFMCQDPRNGGMGDRPGNASDVFHTFFGAAALSLMGHSGLKEISPIYALPVETLKRNCPHITKF